MTFIDPLGNVWPDDVEHRYHYDPLYYTLVHLVGQCVWAFGRFCDRYAP